MSIQQQFIKEHREDDVRELVLRAGRYPGIDMRSAAVQISGWQMARRKLPLWAATEGIVYPEHLSLEQCSSQVTAEYKLSVVKAFLEQFVEEKQEMPDSSGLSMTDLTGGFGVDAAVIARCFDKLLFVERQQALCDIATNNLPLLGIGNVEIINDDSEKVLEILPRQFLIYIDPARRDNNGGKTVAIKECTPDITKFNDTLLHLADMVMIKLSPMLDVAVAERELRGVREIHLVSVDGECKETLLVLTPDDSCCPVGNSGSRGDDVSIYCINMTQKGTSKFVFTRNKEQASTCIYTDTVRKYLYEPNASIMKAGAFKTLSSRFHVEKLHPSSHLYTSDEFQEDFPGRGFIVESYTSFSKKELRQLVGNEKKANITVRNFPATVDELRRRMKLADGGDVYLFATTLADEGHVVIKCRKVR